MDRSSDRRASDRPASARLVLQRLSTPDVRLDHRPFSLCVFIAEVSAAQPPPRPARMTVLQLPLFRRYFRPISILGQYPPMPACYRPFLSSDPLAPQSCFRQRHGPLCHIHGLAAAGLQSPTRSPIVLGSCDIYYSMSLPGEPGLIAPDRFQLALPSN